MLKYSLKYAIVLLAIIIFISCSSTVHLGNTGKYTKRAASTKTLKNDLVGIRISLIDLKNKDKIEIGDVQKLPGKVVDSTLNSKLLVFHRESVPQSIRIDKAGKGSIIFYPEVDKNRSKNLFNFDIYMVPMQHGNF